MTTLCGCNQTTLCGTQLTLYSREYHENVAKSFALRTSSPDWLFKTIIRSQTNQSIRLKWLMSVVNNSPQLNPNLQHTIGKAQGVAQTYFLPDEIIACP